MKTLDELVALYERAGAKPWRHANGKLYDADLGWVAEGMLNDDPDGHLIVALVNAWPEVRERLRRAEARAEAGANLWRYVRACLASDANFRPTGDERRTLERLGREVEMAEDDDAGPMEACGECASTLCDGECVAALRAALTEEPPR